MLFRSTVRLAAIQSTAGELVDIDDDEVGRYEGEIEAGFLIPVDPGAALSSVGFPEPEMLSTVGEPE